jgi:uncharacterized membrane protein
MSDLVVVERRQDGKVKLHQPYHTSATTASTA